MNTTDTHPLEVVYREMVSGPTLMRLGADRDEIAAAIMRRGVESARRSGFGVESVELVVKGRKL